VTTSSEKLSRWSVTVTHRGWTISGGLPYHRGLRERWMTESRCYFLSYAQKVGGTVPPPKSRGTRTPRTSRKLRLWITQC